jgi:hypothetical protein
MACDAKVGPIEQGAFLEAFTSWFSCRSPAWILDENLILYAHAQDHVDIGSNLEILNKILSTSGMPFQNKPQLAFFAV